MAGGAAINAEEAKPDLTQSPIPIPRYEQPMRCNPGCAESPASISAIRSRWPTVYLGMLLCQR